MFMGLLKRFAPFFITFALGLFIASFFVTVAAPRFGFKRNRVVRQNQEIQRLQFENQQLRRELLEQKVRTVEVRRVQEFDDLIAPPAPVAIKKIK